MKKNRNIKRSWDAFELAFREVIRRYRLINIDYDYNLSRKFKKDDIEAMLKSLKNSIAAIKDTRREL